MNRQRSVMLLALCTVCYAATGAQALWQQYGTEGDDLLEGSAEADYLAGLGGDDVLIGYEGDDQLFGGCGSDLYTFGRVIGHDELRDGSACLDGRGRSIRERNEVDFTYYYEEEVEPVRDGQDLVLRIDGGHQVRVVGFIDDPYIERFDFEDGARWSARDVRRRLGLQTPATLLDGLQLQVFSTQGGSESVACAQAFAFVPGKTEYVCDGIFLEAGLTLRAVSPGADSIELAYQLCTGGETGRCNDPIRHRTETRTLRSGSSFRVPGFLTTYGEEHIHNVDAVLTVTKKGKRERIRIRLVSGQYR